MGIKNSSIHKIFLLIVLSALLLSSCNLIKKTGSRKEKETDASSKLFAFNKFFLEACRQKYIGNFDEALNNYMQANDVDNTQSAVSYEIAGLLSNLNDFAGAELYAKRAVDSDKTKNKYYKVLLSIIYKNNNKLPETAGVMEELIKENPSSIEFYFGLTSVYLEMAKPKKAISTLNKAEKHFGVYEEISLEKENIYSLLGEKKKAIEEVEKLVDAYPQNSRYMAILAEKYAINGGKSKAKKIYESIDKLDQIEGIVYFSSSEFYFMANEINKAFDYAFLGFQSDEILPETKEKFAKMILQALTKDNLDANNRLRPKILKMLNILAEKHPDQISLRILNASYLFYIGDLESSFAEYDYILSVEKGNYEVWTQALELSFLNNNLEKMYEYSKEAVELYPNSFDLYKYYVMSSYLLKKYEDVILAVEQASSLPKQNDSFFVDLLCMQGDAYNALKMFHQSDSVYDKVLFLDNENLTVLNNYSYFLALRKENLDKALLMSEKMISINSKESIFLDTHAWVLYKNGKFEEALKYIDKALLINPDNSVYLEHKGDILYGFGRKEEAINLWIKAASLGEGSDLLKEKIENKKLIEY